MRADKGFELRDETSSGGIRNNCVRKEGSEGDSGGGEFTSRENNSVSVRGLQITYMASRTNGKIGEREDNILYGVVDILRLECTKTRFR